MEKKTIGGWEFGEVLKKSLPQQFTVRRLVLHRRWQASDNNIHFRRLSDLIMSRIYHRCTIDLAIVSMSEGYRSHCLCSYRYVAVPHGVSVIETP